MLELKQYQLDALDKLAEYSRLTRAHGAKRAFMDCTEDALYHPVPDLPELPYVCLRVPTGGGKTLMAAHAVGVLTREMLEVEHSVVLWLAPTKVIVGQTLEALTTPGHPYREALQSRLGGGPIEVLGLSEALGVQRAVLDGSTTVIVSTLAALRVEDTEGRKIYETNGSLMSHFSGLTEAQKADLEPENGDGGAVAYSLANVLRLRRPLIIMDEAHNARTETTFKTLSRFQPSCVLELTATPQRHHNPEHGKFASNVLFEVNALALKLEHMIKLPIRLETHTDWRMVLVEALRRRDELERLAIAEERETGEYLRPILLVQAQPTFEDGRDSLTVEKVEEALLAEKVPAEWIRRATGKDRQIEGLNLLKRGEVRVLITVKALAEGWDCSFAYVLCSVAEIGSPKDVEQILGRIMRLPGARERRHEDLNRGYAYVASSRFAATANTLTDTLVSCYGFEKLDAQRMVEAKFALPWEEGLFREEPAPVRRGEQMSVPCLARWENGRLDLWDPEDFLDVNWCLAHESPELTEEAFPTSPASPEEGMIDITPSGKMQYGGTFTERATQQLGLLIQEKTMTVTGLAAWLDRNYEHPDVSDEHSRLFCKRVVEYLHVERGFRIEELVRRRWGLRDAIRRRVNELRQEAKRKRFGEVLQGKLLEGEQVRVDPATVFMYPTEYPYHRRYTGRLDFKKHFYEAVEHMNGEEELCAQVIDRLPQVRCWVRNLEKEPVHAFWLPVPQGKFYPDFVAKLHDGRYLVVEYKGKLEDPKDSRDKRDIGELWAAESHGRCIFYWATADNYRSMESVLA